MTTAYICRTCRLRAAVTKRPRLTHPTPRWLSQTSSLREDGPDGVFDNTLQDRRSQPPSHSGTGGGRYSSRALRPHQLLEQLDISPSPPAKTTRPQRPDRNAKADRPRRRENPSATTTPTSPPALFEFRGRIIRATKPEPEDSLDKIWTLLQELVQDERNHSHFNDVLNDRNFAVAISRWQSRVSDAWLHNLSTLLSRPPPASEEGPQLNQSPILQTLQVCALFGVNYKYAATRALWIMGRDLAEHFGPSSRVGSSISPVEEDVIRHLLDIWHLCLGLQLREHDPNRTSRLQFCVERIVRPSTSDWSFLPEPYEQLISTQDMHDGIQRFDVLDRTISDTTGIAPYGTASMQAVNSSTTSGARQDDSVSAAIVALEVFRATEQRFPDRVIFQESKPLIDLLSTIIKVAPPKRIPIAIEERVNSGVSPNVRHHYEAMLGRFGLRLSRETEPETGHNVVKTSPRTTGPGIEVPLTSGDKVRTDVGSIAPEFESKKRQERLTYLSINRLGRSVEQRDVRAAERVGQDVLLFQAQHPVVQLPLQLYEHLMLSFLSLRNFDAALVWWNHMTKAGHHPTCKTYTILIRHSAYLKGTDAIRFFWTHMRQQRIQPDAYAWSAYIYGIFHRGTPESGLKALIDMGREWATAASTGRQTSTQPSKSKNKAKSSAPRASTPAPNSDGTIDGVPRPTVAIVNSAIAGLDKRAHTDLIPKILAWSRSFGIEPDINTYNMLISVSMRKNASAEALGIIKRMREKHVPTNGETWTILLNAIFESGSLDGLSPEEQQSKVMTLIRAVEDGSATNIDAKGYAILLDRMTKLYNNMPAAQAILDHMASRGIEPTPHHYTVLMTAYFHNSPPDFASVENLWNRLEQGNNGYGTPLDSQFYDRMIEEYARHHNIVGTKPALRFLSRMEAEGKHPSWRALECAARALAESREWEKLSQIVERTRRNMRAMSVGGTKTGQHDFWNFIISTGLLGDAYSDGNQIMREHMGREAGLPQS